MKFKSIETGKVYENWDDAPCSGQCGNCPACSINNGTGDNCRDYLEKHPSEAKKLGYEVFAPYEKPKYWKHVYLCPCCGNHFKDLSNYCPHCGERLYKEEER